MGAKKQATQNDNELSATDAISAPVVVHRARGKRNWTQGDVGLERSLQAVQRAIDCLERDVARALAAERGPALSAITSAVRSTPPHGSLVCACVLMGGGAAGGDRAAIFDGVCTHLAKTHDVLELRAASPPGVRALRDDLRIRAQAGPTIVALDDADVPAARDILYVVADVARDASRKHGEGRVALVVGAAADAAALHAACGQHEASQVAVVVVPMSGARSLLSTLVRDVLYKQIDGPLLERTVFDLIQDEFYERDCTLSMVMRTMRHAYTVHFMHNSLAAELAIPPPGVDTLIEAEFEERDVKLPKDLGGELRRTPSVQASLKAKTQAQQVNEWASELRRWRHRRRTIEGLFWELLCRTDAYQSGIEHRVGGKGVPHRMLMYKAFLPAKGSEANRQPILRIVLEEVSRAQRHQLLNYVKLACDALGAHSVASDAPIETVLAKLREIDTQLRECAPSAGISTSSGTPSRPNAPDITPRAKGAGAAASKRRAALLGGAGTAAAAAGKQALLTARKAATEALQSLLDLACGAHNVALHEAVVLGHASDVVRTSGGIGGAAEPRSSVLGALRDPKRHLGDIALAATPDNAVAYQILNEGAKLVNLYDWYNSFAALRGAHNGEDAVMGDIGDEVTMQARFARSTAELEFIGLTRATKRKTDHVQRLVFE